MIVYRVYWSKMIGPNDAEIRSADFSNNELTGALNLMESLRLIQRTDNSIGFITICSENPDSVGNPGVGVTGSDYAWTKRR